MAGPDDQRKRRLPLIQPRDDDGGEQGERPAWHAAVWGALATMLALLPLAALAQLVVRRVLDSRLPAGTDPLAAAAAFDALAPAERLFVRVVMAAAPLAALALAALLGALVVARWGGGGATKREGVVGGALAGLLAAATGASAYLQHGELLTWLLTTLVIVTVAALAALAGTSLGLRWRRRGR